MLAAGATAAHAANIPVPNGDFEDAGGAAFHGTVGGTGEAYTTPSSFGPGWQLTGEGGVSGTEANGSSGKYGLQQPRSSDASHDYYDRSTPVGTDPPGDLSAPFNGNLIGFMNLDNVDNGDPSTDTTERNYVQSGVLGTITEGTYSLTVAVGARPSTSWNDVTYAISLIADPDASSGIGSTGGTILGTPASVTLVPSTATVGSNAQDLNYTLNIAAGDALIGHSFAVRIDAMNPGTQGGVANADPTNFNFTQANFDNVRLDGPAAAPEPASLAAIAGGGLLLLRRRRRA
ncbi:MAG: PEP-CTERM sorting domain-containing protein [Phycisphaerae bacterium]